MRKFLLIALMVALVPFATGCRIDGLWGFNDNSGTTVGGTTTVAAKKIPVGINLPKNIPAGSIHNNFDGTSVTVNVVFGTTLVPLTRNLASDTATAANYYNASVDVTSATVVGSNYSLKIALTSGGNTFYMTVSVPTGLSVDASGNSQLVSISFTTLTINADGSVSFTVVVTYTATGASTATTGSPSTGTTGATNVLYVASATVGTSNLSQVSTLPTTGVDFLAPTFIVSFNKAIKAIPASFTVTATNLSTNNTFAMTASNSQINVSLDTTGKIITAAVTGTGAKNLTPFTNYSIAVSGLFTDASNNTYTVSVTYYIQTRKALMTSWYAMNGTVVVGTWTSSITTPTVASTANSVKLNFDYPVSTTIGTNLSTSTFNKTISGTNGTSLTNLGYSTYFSAPTVSGSMVTIPFAKTLTTGSYSVTFNSGSLNDVNGKALDTTATMTFTVN